MNADWRLSICRTALSLWTLNTPPGICLTLSDVSVGVSVMKKISLTTGNKNVLNNAQLKHFKGVDSYQQTSKARFINILLAQ